MPRISTGTISPQQWYDYFNNPRADLQIEKWREFYRNHFGISLELVKVPVYQAPISSVIVIPQGLTLERVLEIYRWKYKSVNQHTEVSLDELVSHNDRNPKNGAYAVWFRFRDDIRDGERRVASATDLAYHKIPGVTLLECLVLRLKHFVESGKDFWDDTLCNGSLTSDGSVPKLGRGPYPTKAQIRWVNPSRRGYYHNFCEVIASPTV
ncbi:MAG: hypothetical protein JWN89_276 [Parcubacteria group bacterium]|nr:hypothetical protein [Parcubacteria group bacterium]